MNKKRTRIKNTYQDTVLQVFSISIVLLFCIFCLLPFVMMISASFETEGVLLREGYSLWPRKFTAEAYKIIFTTPQVLRSYGVTIFVTVVGTTLAMLLTVTFAYPLAQKKLKFRGVITFYVYFTMLFGGGLVPTYLLISRTLGLRDSIWVLIIPSIFSAWNMFLMRNFFQSLPAELAESAYIDGANDVTILFRIALPLSKPAIATISLFYALGFWNAWFNAMLYIDTRELMPLQYLIMDMIRSVEAVKEMSQATGVPLQSLPGNALKMATTVVAIGPVILLYPFAQKYFTQGLTVGAIKG